METTVETKTKWGIDPVHSEVGFKVKHLMIATVSGTFKEYEGSIYTTAEDFMTAEVDFWINPASIYTGDAKRDEHLRSADFFDVENFKEINFSGNTYEQIDTNGHYKLYGDLTIKGITKQVKLNVKFKGVKQDPWGNDKAVFAIKGKINRKDFGLTWNVALEAGGILIGEDIKLRCHIQLVKQQ